MLFLCCIFGYIVWVNQIDKIDWYDWLIYESRGSFYWSEYFSDWLFVPLVVQNLSYAWEVLLANLVAAIETQYSLSKHAKLTNFIQRMLKPFKQCHIFILIGILALPIIHTFLFTTFPLQIHLIPSTYVPLTTSISSWSPTNYILPIILIFDKVYLFLII